MIKDSKEAWYRKMDYMSLEFQWGRRKGPGLPFILKIRQAANPEDIYEYEVMDIATAPIGAYLRLAETSIIEKAEKRAKDERNRRSAEFDRNDRERLEIERQAREGRHDATKTEGEQLQERSIGEPERKAQGSVAEKDDSRRDDEVQHDRVPDPVKKKRGRPRKDRGESRTGSQTG